MRRELCAVSGVILCVALAGCGAAVSGDHPVTTADQAIEQAKVALIGTPQAQGPFKVVRDADTWNVSAPPSATGAVSVYVSAKTGRAAVYTEDAADVRVAKPS